MPEPDWARERAREIYSANMHHSRRDFMIQAFAAELRKDRELAEAAEKDLGCTLHRESLLSAAVMEYKAACQAAEKRAAALEAALTEEKRRSALFLRQCGDLQGKAASMEWALDSLLPGLAIDLKYASPDDDRDALVSRVRTVEEALRDYSGALALHDAEVRRAALLEAAEHLRGGGSGYCSDSEQAHVWAERNVLELAEEGAKG